ncbi:NAD(P)H-dependent glycerol-3-phosphate dehydrogenase [Aurantimonas sp. C2-6-R+9]|uniref:NAD(P)H-dependent glycerol-3-phosphate dehydrogenase n=1 Tax=unclassified Aurantimonas TaxID=2638230 RepID=UPI002E1900B6|nr:MULTISPECIES: NAD(P)H-dependent glycerol-3-phosphate dehydrogenase [unclassified Aurantimonas]MEC5289763.1 NAD(P)H-dependent glycerol-3-phosphate dehydrogenase [Aurantimonas sp. C2-3-R2]MEC5379730.1 NAD(P)H-dependent glycerol-3-phosphate dehydrogenase [Aurantimonas sp. C2-6-R+9]MEC5410799.1 NAD(P)H-dependent glycerol-3-phosphate dehydrogenase [Aurantimonas sp. C2-4-R8]
MTRFAIVGGGAWGTALGCLYARAGHHTVLYARDAETVAGINRDRLNPRYLPEIDLPDSLAATSDPAEALAGADIVLFVVPAQSLSVATAELDGLVPPGALAVLCAKGIERGTGRFASQIFSQAQPAQPLAVLSGPSFAADVARGLPTAVTIAAGEPALADRAARLLSTETFRCYAASDVVGVEAGGALKNVLALAAGAVVGRGLGASAQAAIITRGFVELRRLGAALGGQPETLMGLSGLGDLVLTCSSPQSRNFAYGMALGRGDDRFGLKLAEGVFTAEIAARLARDLGIDAPIIATVAAILSGDLDVDAAVQSLLARPLKREFD